MNRSVLPVPGRGRPSSEAAAAASRVRTAVVPTATTRPPASFVSRTAAAASGGIHHRSGCIGWSSTRSAFTGRKVPGPTARVTAVRRTPRASQADSSSAVKWSPAVGAAAATGSRAKTVW